MLPLSAPAIAVFDSGERYIVRTKAFRCLAYRDTAGAWRSAYNPQSAPLDVLDFELLSGAAK